jgi:hypothetical protein
MQIILVYKDLYSLSNIIPQILGKLQNAYLVEIGGKVP